ncbi:RNA polymerase sigma factor [Bacillus phage Bastille]|uniref:RNA polymerase sigma factor n=2 Tax=Bastillevirus TaxID=1918010 RepID=A0A024B0L3_9CAUD|nr:RNA polymerase sigma factor [Bacillus phage Bastille]YP_009035734.1 RNA polymerase sigma factor [Bacillus phage Evoli]ASR79669.1 RNA polymerase sigma factor [Bacillus phage OTooleKemple52]AXQ67115.1 RNA polymerase [Bacillus phage Kamfam]AEQ34342.1 RNA polymerase sigma-F factor [Bacillus phage Bastille]AHZ09937.1 RNA polymerase sigma factor [Bacillus phage Evoli]
MEQVKEKIKHYDSIVQAQEGSEEASDYLFAQYKDMIWNIIHQVSPIDKEGVNEDLFQIGSLAFVQAIQTFNVDLGYEFSTYLYQSIKGRILKGLRHKQDLKVPNDIYNISIRIRKNYLMDESVETITSVLDISEEDATKAMDYLRASAALSMDTTIASDKSNSGNAAMVSESISGDLNGHSWEDGINLRELVDKLPANEKHIIARKYFEDAKRSDLCDELGIHENTVYKIEQRALNKLRAFMTGKDTLVTKKDTPRHTSTKAAREEAKKLLKEGKLSYVHISRQTGVSENTIATWASKLRKGIEI